MSRHAAFADETTEIKPGQGLTEVEDTEGGRDYTASLAQTGTRQTDPEKSSSHSEAGLTHRHEHAVATRKLLLKLDLTILPFAVLLYLSAYLDRGNLGNARLQGLEAQVLNGSDTNYSIALSCFFITYILFSIPGTLLAKQFNPSYTIAIGALTWSLGATLQAAAFNRAGLFVCRLIVGVGEAMFGQAMAFHLSLWYTKKDLAKRVGLFISAGALSGAFTGLISYGVSSIHHPKIEAWKVLFLIEGLPSFVLAVCVALFMPSRPETSKLLSEDERTLCLTRLNADSSVEQHTGVDLRGVTRCLTDWKTYVVSISYSCMNLGLGSVGGFLPTIIKGLGYSNAKAQLFTVPPYVVALVFMLLLTTYSDRYQTRGIPATAVFVIGIVGWAILLAVPAHHPTATELHVRYFGCICVVTAGYTNIPIIISWQSGNTGNQSQRATSLGMLNSLGQCLGLAAAFMFPSTEKPQFRKGCIINVAFQCLGLVLVLGMSLYYRWENKRRDKVEGGRPPRGAALDTMEQHDLAPGFRYVP
ncbi:major facilitator superfamily domain-containing protein [Kockovaella imperatae]|uniref:Major facilitator superfamily domain-containing protein n=1 Tax=Kockovaella imperatae TaxID=4999 RepID=A0A1Y1UIS9_9TREE|nr:major facilitator superfamily domain-containing protein [Kockovaella imperatae]ORX37396.1 major facilitator superfamily domain-containing protein [Kockovaella imperatae]